jgi:hypothetical protein
VFPCKNAFPPEPLFQLLAYPIKNDKSVFYHGSYYTFYPISLQPNQYIIDKVIKEEGLVQIHMTKILFRILMEGMAVNTYLIVSTTSLEPEIFIVTIVRLIHMAQDSKLLENKRS